MLIKDVFQINLKTWCIKWQGFRPHCHSI